MFVPRLVSQPTTRMSPTHTANTHTAVPKLPPKQQKHRPISMSPLQQKGNSARLATTVNKLWTIVTDVHRRSFYSPPFMHFKSRTITRSVTLRGQRNKLGTAEICVSECRSQGKLRRIGVTADAKTSRCRFKSRPPQTAEPGPIPKHRRRLGPAQSQPGARV